MIEKMTGAKTCHMQDLWKIGICNKTSMCSDLGTMPSMELEINVELVGHLWSGSAAVIPSSWYVMRSGMEKSCSRRLVLGLSF